MVDLLAMVFARAALKQPAREQMTSGVTEDVK
jgi:hypothetical protein